MHFKSMKLKLGLLVFYATTMSLKQETGIALFWYNPIIDSQKQGNNSRQGKFHWCGFQVLEFLIKIRVVSLSTDKAPASCCDTKAPGLLSAISAFADLLETSMMAEGLCQHQFKKVHGSLHWNTSFKAEYLPLPPILRSFLRKVVTSFIPKKFFSATIVCHLRILL